MMHDAEAPAPSERNTGAAGAFEVPLARPIGVDPAYFLPPDPDPLLLPGLRRSAAWVDMIILVVGIVAIDLLASRILVRISGIEISDGPSLPPEVKRHLLVPTVVTRAISSCVLVGVLLRLRGQGIGALGLGRRGWGWDLVFGLVTLGVASGLSYGIMLTVVFLWPEAMKLIGQNNVRLMELVPRLSLPGFVGLMAVVGFYEELLFRGFLMPRLRRAIGNWTIAVLVSTVLFALPHAADQAWIALVPITILSLVFSAVTIWRRSLVPAVVAHALFNLGVVLILEFAAGEQWS